MNPERPGSGIITAAGTFLAAVDSQPSWFYKHFLQKVGEINEIVTKMSCFIYKTWGI